MSYMKLSARLDTSYQGQLRPFRDGGAVPGSLTGINMRSWSASSLSTSAAYTRVFRCLNTNTSRGLKSGEHGDHAVGSSLIYPPVMTGKVK
jgi:hypothetical protein